jgi:hypothetical protein
MIYFIHLTAGATQICAKVKRKPNAEWSAPYVNAIYRVTCKFNLLLEVAPGFTGSPELMIAKTFFRGASRAWGSKENRKQIHPTKSVELMIGNHEKFLRGVTEAVEC